MLPTFAWSGILEKGASNISFEQLTPNRVHLKVEVALIEREAIKTADGTLDRIWIEGEGSISKPGWPDLPVISRTILAPPRGNPSLKNLTLTSHEEANLNPLPAPPPETDDLSLAKLATDFNQYSGWYPPETVVTAEPALLRDYRLVTVHIFPVQYNPATGQVRFTESAEFSLEFEGEGVNELTDPRRIPPSRFARMAVDELVINPPDKPLRDDILTGNYLYIVPNVDGVDDAFSPLLEWRRRMGHQVTVRHVGNNAQAATVMGLIRDAFAAEGSVEFVCLVGDAANSDVIVPAATQTGDYEYSKLNGNDPLPDVAIGRISIASVAQLRQVIGKIVSYETNPYMEETRWFRQGGVVAGHIQNGYGEVLLARWVKKQLLEYGFREVRGWYWDVDGEIGGNQPFITNTLDWGVSIFHYRAYSHMNSINPAVIINLPNDEGRWPAVLAISCNTGNFVSETNGNYQGVALTEDFLRARGGGIGAIGTHTGNTNVRFNNLVAAGVWKGVYKNRTYCLGWGLNQGKYEIWQTYAGFDDAYLGFMDWNNLMGDPGTAIWTDVPVRVTAEYPRQFPLGSNLLPVRVLAPGGVPVKDAQVCLYKSGELQIVGTTDREGRTWLTIPTEGINEGRANLTVVKHNVFPLQANIDLVAPQSLLTAEGFIIDDDREDGSEGNGDEVVNPGETIEYGFSLSNAGRNNLQGAVSVEINSLSTWAAPVEGGFELEAAPAAGESVALIAPIEIDPSIPDKELVRIEFIIRNGQNVWESVGEFEAHSPHISVRRVIVDDNQLSPSDVKHLRVEVENLGSIALQPSRARILSLNDLVAAVDDESEYVRIPVGGVSLEDGQPFRIRAHPMAVPGMVVPVMLIVETEAGFIDTARFSISLTAPDNTDPFGPDEYGYICFDSGDEGWDMKPTYEWVELNPAINPHQFNGTNLNISDNGDNQDTSKVVDLPFNFFYYGQEYDQLTICTNGWAAFGDQDELANFRKQHIGQAMCPNAMLAVWWDNLYHEGNSAILYHYDRENGRFIVEWSRMVRLVEGGGGSIETFELILYDQDVHPTSSGDGIIVYQYREVTNQNRVAHNDLPYCAIGITDPEGDLGLEYTYWARYPVGARVIGNGMAIKFMTLPLMITGVIEGRIRDAETGEPIPDAQVLSTKGFWAESDENGFYRIDDILVGDDYSLTASALGWNDSTLADFDVVEAETIRVDFTLLHPEFVASTERIDYRVNVGNVGSTRINIANEGNGPLHWTSRPRLVQEVEAVPWEHRLTIPIGQIADDDRMEGAVFADDRFFVAGANGDATNLIYILSRDGELIDSFPQAGHTRYGFKDLEWDGEWIWGSNEDSVFAFTVDGEVTRRFLGPHNPNSSLAWDSERECLWLSGITTSLIAVDREGQRVGRTIPRGSVRIFGLTYYPEDPLGMGLYIQSQNDGVNIALYRVDPEAGDIEFYRTVNPPNSGSPTGCAIVGSYDPLIWCFLSVLNITRANGGIGDLIDIYQLDQRTDWMRTRPREGTLMPGEEQEVEVSIGARDLPVLELQGDLNFIHNAAGGRTSLRVNLSVVAGAGAQDDRILDLREGWNLISLNVTPNIVDILQLMQPLVEDGNLVMMKDGQGRYYNPEHEFNSIPFFNPADGYQLFVNDNVRMVVRGTVIAADDTIQLNRGWNMVSYFPRQAINCQDALDGITEQLIIAKNGDGQFYLPEYQYDNLGLMREGLGYQLKVEEDIQLIYREPRGIEAVWEEPSIPVHFTSSRPSSENHSLLILGDVTMNGWEAEVRSSRGVSAGTGMFDASGRCGISLRGDDPSTAEIDGLLEGEDYAVWLWNGRTERQIHLEVVKGEQTWTPDGVTVARVTDTPTPTEFGLASIYPNPFNSTTRITFGLRDRDNVEIGLYDIAGRHTATILSGDYSPGLHSVTWSGEDIPSGIYFVRISSRSGRTDSQKLVLVR
jgi:hypothetical protein